MIGTRAQRRHRLHPWAKLPEGNPREPLGSGDLPTDGTDQPRPWIFGHDRPDGRDLRHLMSLGLPIFPMQQVLTARASLGLDRDHHIHLLDRHQDAGVPLVARLAARPTPTGLAPWPLAEGRRRIARRRPRGGARVLLHPLGHLLDRSLPALHEGLQHGAARFEHADVLLRLDGRTLPDLWWP